MAGTRADILVVDNDERIVELLAWFLEKRGYQVRCAGSFGEARAALAESQPDLMLSDVDLGAQNARVELPRLERDGLLPPTLVVSGFLDADLRAELLALEPVLDTLAKPFEFETLEAHILACLARVSGGAGTSVPTDPAAASADLQAGEIENDEGWVEVRPAAPGPGGIQE